MTDVAAATATVTASPPPPVDKTGYQGFGSFHSEDVEVLVRQDPATYQPPALPFPDPAAAPAAACPAASFGDAAKRHFLIDFSSWTFLNHGAFGGVAAPAYSAAEQWRRQCELQPLEFIDRQLFPQLVRVLRELAAFVNCRPQDLVLLPNATTGLNAVISSFRGLLQPGDAVYSLDIGYGSVKKMLQAACDASGATMAVGQVAFPISGPEDLLQLVAATMPPNTKLAVFDAVTSNTALVLPAQQLVQLCRGRGVPVLIDAAHALGMLPLDLQQLQPDFLVTNCHKWLCGARGSAMLYAAEPWQQQLQPPVLSHGAAGGFLSRFIWDGCRDYSSLLAVSSAVRWWRRLGTVEQQQEQNAIGSSCDNPGPTAAQQQQQQQRPAPEACCDPALPAHPGDGGTAARCYMYRLLRDAAQLLQQHWGTGCLGPASMTAAMTLVQLPSAGVLPSAGSATSADAKYIQDLLHFQHGIECPVKCINSDLYVRISAHVYNTLGEFQRLGDAVQHITTMTGPRQN